jgi:prolyl-tRNA synthetase
MEKATVAPPEKSGDDSVLLPLQKVETPGKRKVGAVCDFLGIAPRQLVKTMIYLADNRPVAVLVRGDHEVQPVSEPWRWSLPMTGKSLTSLAAPAATSAP